MKRDEFWLIENKGFNSSAFYADNKCFRWMPFCDDVVRFDTKADAEAAMSSLPDAEKCIVTSHSVMPELTSGEEKNDDE